ncbi:MAG: serine/threonine-protein phosphatase [Phycisphaerales bacterium]|nr:serine/threonine-protein phosphatase [Phycisphaerales bacterium]
MTREGQDRAKGVEGSGSLGVLVAVCSSLIESGGARGWWAELERHWPACNQHPGRVTSCTTDDVIERAGSAEELRSVGAALIVASAATPRATLLRCVNVVRESGRPGVVVLPSSDPGLIERLGGGTTRTGASGRVTTPAGHAGIVVVTGEPDTRAICGLLAGMSALAEPLRQLEQEVELATATQQSARRWIRRVDDELHLAAKMQRELLPSAMPALGCFTSAALFKPLWHVSGDVYRAWRLDETHMGFMIADAMGHGVRAAMATMILAHELVLKETTGSGYRLIPPGEALARLNEQMVSHPSEAMRFASALCGIADCATGEVHLAAAGHPHPLLASPDGTVQKFELDGAVLGVFDGAEFAQSTIRLTPGQMLVMYTDGAEDALPIPGKVDGVRPVVDKAELMCHALAQCLRDNAGVSTHERLLAFGAMLDSLSGSLHRADDVTMLAIQRRDGVS